MPLSLFEMAQRLSGVVGGQPECGGEGGDVFARVAPEHWRTAARALREGAGLEFDFLRSLTAVDRPADGRIEVAAHLYSYRNRQALVLKTRLDRTGPRLASLGGIWPAAIWHERELWEMFGVEIEGHPDLRHLLLPEDWQGHPLRKDYLMPERYQGIPTRRPSPAAGTEASGMAPKNPPEAP